jgi:hypothetical protein
MQSNDRILTVAAIRLGADVHGVLGQIGEALEELLDERIVVGGGGGIVVVVVLVRTSGGIRKTNAAWSLNEHP